ncbi:sigma 54-interacting transcriptional regulator [Sporomusa aerivorans]|uniref:sigma 54-interacting transcriptional regulator n=1 Tax=Sporomusa aerivorans TaxID=204936 RepID=UPI00352AF330
MTRIVFIAPNKQLFLLGKKAVKELNLEEIIDVSFARPRRAVEMAKHLYNEGVDVIISRGGTASIIESEADIPVVEIKISGQDIAQTFQQAKLITGLPNPKVAFVVFRNMSNNIEVLSDILSIRLSIYAVNEMDEIPAVIEQIALTDADIVVGGARSVNLAVKKGLKALLINSGDHSIKAAFLEAKKVAHGRRIEKERTQKFKTLIDYSLEGIISINSEKEIDIFNPTAERLLNLSQQEMKGKKIEENLPFAGIDACLQENREIIGQITQFSHRWLSYNLAPILVNQTSVGVMITFQDVTLIQEIEAKVRQNVIAKKFFAKYSFENILGNSPEITETKTIAEEIAKVDATVLILGESGTGKELFAQSIHNRSQRKNGPFVAVNCAALPPNLLESELFGYVDGAFTGANRKGKVGLFEMAHYGTLFLDEISEMDKYAQSRLLRVLQEKQIMRLGDDKYIPIDVRIIAASNKDLATLVDEGSFRGDLFHRLNVLPLDIPALRERNNDVLFLAQHFLTVSKQKYQKQLAFTTDSLAFLSAYTWPGNVRELMYLVERLVIITNTPVLTPEVIQHYWKNKRLSNHTVAPDRLAAAPEAEKITGILRDCNGNIKHTAEQLGIDRSTLYKKLKQYKIEVKKSY